MNNVLCLLVVTVLMCLPNVNHAGCSWVEFCQPGLRFAPFGTFPDFKSFGAMTAAAAATSSMMFCTTILHVPKNERQQAAISCGHQLSFDGNLGLPLAQH